MTFNVKSSDVNWEAMERQVVEKLHLLRVAWEGTEKEGSPETHALLVQDIYAPAIGLLAEFCSCVEAEPEVPA